MGRVPATFQVFVYALDELKRLAPLSPSSCLDIGSGPGASYWAIKEAYPQISSVALLENNRYMQEVLSLLLADEPSVSFIKKAANQFNPDQSYDFISFSYSLGEMEKLEDILGKYWFHTNKALIITEPGTPAGFQTILKARDFLRAQGAFFVAPCGHKSPCPLANQDKDWCHFSVRIERTNSHRVLKKGSLNYEDEKFSYLIATKEEFIAPGARILKRPLKGKGHVRLDLCTPDGIEKKTFSKSNSADYKELKNKDWGDLFE